MELPTDSELEAAHRFFSADCFNRAWEFIDKRDRTEEDKNAMLLLSLASLWHWTQRKDAAPANLSVGYWQVSRVYALLGQPGNAREFGLLSLAESQKEGVGPFYLGYSYEALARAEALAGNREGAQEYAVLAQQAGDSVEDAASRQMLLDDLGTI